jgi:hypothetical protein
MTGAAAAPTVGVEISIEEAGSVDSGTEVLDFGRVRRVLTVAAVAGGLIVGGAAGLSSTAVADSAPSAVTAKKKCKAKCKRRKATNFLAGHTYTRVTYSSTGASQNLRLDLCRNGTLHARGDYVGYSGYAWADGYDGTWRVASATKTSANAPFTTSGYWVSDPYYASPPPASGTMMIAAISANQVTIAGAEFSRGAGTC